MRCSESGHRATVAIDIFRRLSRWAWVVRPLGPGVPPAHAITQPCLIHQGCEAATVDFAQYSPEPLQITGAPEKNCG